MIEAISGTVHPKVELLSRFVTFYKSLIKSSKLGVRMLARISERDCRTVMGRTLDRLSKLCSLKDIMELSSSHVRRDIVYHEVPDEELRRISMIKELIEFDIEGFSDLEVAEMKDYICCN